MDCTEHGKHKTTHSTMLDAKVSERRCLPEKCTSCSKELNVGISFFVLVCHLHAICSECRHPGDLTWCPYCADAAEQKRKLPDQSQFVPEHRNSLPLLPTSGSRHVTTAHISSVNDYTPLYWPPVNPLSYADIFKFNHDVSSCWSAGYKDHIILGGWDKPTLTVMAASGEIVKHVLSCGKSIMSGVFVKMWMYIVCVSTETFGFDTSFNRLHLIIQDPTSTEPNNIAPLINFDTRNPVYVFKKSAQLFGVLCMDEFRGFYSHGRLRLLSLPELILTLNTDKRTLSCTALWGRRTLSLNLPEPYLADTVAVNGRGHVCIASYQRNEIRVYSCTGVYLYTIVNGLRNRTCRDIDRLDEMYFHPKVKQDKGVSDNPNSIMCTANNRLVITGRYFVTCYDMNSTSGTLRKKYDWYDESGGNNEDENSSRRVHFEKDDPAGWSLSLIRRDDGRATCSCITPSRFWIIRKNEEHDDFYSEFKGNFIYVFNINNSSEHS